MVLGNAVGFCSRDGCSSRKTLSSFNLIALGGGCLYTRGHQEQKSLCRGGLPLPPGVTGFYVVYRFVSYFLKV